MTPHIHSTHYEQYLGINIKNHPLIPLKSISKTQISFWGNNLISFEWALPISFTFAVGSSGTIPNRFIEAVELLPFGLKSFFAEDIWH